MIIDIRRKGVPSLGPTLPMGPCADGYGSGDRDVFHVEFDRDGDPVSRVIVRSVAAIHDQHPDTLEPLARVVDPAMLDHMVDEGTRAGSHGGEFTFVYEDVEVTVNTDGHIWLERL